MQSIVNARRCFNDRAAFGAQSVVKILAERLTVTRFDELTSDEHFASKKSGPPGLLTESNEALVVPTPSYSTQR